jgi:hypothetical protein
MSTLNVNVIQNLSGVEKYLLITLVIFMSSWAGL